MDPTRDYPHIVTAAIEIPVIEYDEYNLIGVPELSQIVRVDETNFLWHKHAFPDLENSLPSVQVIFVFFF